MSIFDARNYFYYHSLSYYKCHSHPLVISHKMRQISNKYCQVRIMGKLILNNEKIRGSPASISKRRKGWHCDAYEPWKILIAHWVHSAYRLQLSYQDKQKILNLVGWRYHRLKIKIRHHLIKVTLRIIRLTIGPNYKFHHSKVQYRKASKVFLVIFRNQKGQVVPRTHGQSTRKRTAAKSWTIIFWSRRAGRVS